MNKEEAETLAASAFQLAQEMNRGNWDIDKECEKLISFAKSFEKDVKMIMDKDASLGDGDE